MIHQVHFNKDTEETLNKINITRDNQRIDRPDRSVNNGEEVTRKSESHHCENLQIKMKEKINIGEHVNDKSEKQKKTAPGIR